jgi:hypothetical protein
MSPLCLSDVVRRGQLLGRHPKGYGQLSDGSSVWRGLARLKALNGQLVNPGQAS